MGWIIIIVFCFQSTHNSFFCLLFYYILCIIRDEIEKDNCASTSCNENVVVVYSILKWFIEWLFECRWRKKTRIYTGMYVDHTDNTSSLFFIFLVPHIFFLFLINKKKSTKKKKTQIMKKCPVHITSLNSFIFNHIYHSYTHLLHTPQ